MNFVPRIVSEVVGVVSLTASLFLMSPVMKRKTPVPNLIAASPVPDRRVVDEFIQDDGRIGADLDLGLVLEADHGRGGTRGLDGFSGKDVMVEHEIVGAGRGDSQALGAVEVFLDDISDLLIGEGDRGR